VCAVFFLRKSIQPKPNSASTANGVARPPPPSFQPPSLPSYKMTPSPHFRDQQQPNGSPCYRENGRYIRTGERKSHMKPSMAEYHLYDAQARVPLNTSFAPEDRDLYETTPQPYEIDYEHSDVEYYPDCGRLQPYPSLYSCR